MSKLLTTASTIVCSHGARAILVTSNQVTSAGGRVLVETDVHTIVGCPFYAGSNYSPCVRITWKSNVTDVTIRGVKVLTKASVGSCKNAQGVVQGIARATMTQQAASAR